MNNYPRKLFNYKSANDIFYENLKLLLKMLQSFLDFTFRFYNLEFTLIFSLDKSIKVIYKEYP